MHQCNETAEYRLPSILGIILHYVALGAFKMISRIDNWDESNFLHEVTTNKVSDPDSNIFEQQSFHIQSFLPLPVSRSWLIENRNVG